MMISRIEVTISWIEIMVQEKVEGGFLGQNGLWILR